MAQVYQIQFLVLLLLMLVAVAVQETQLAAQAVLAAAVQVVVELRVLLERLIQVAVAAVHLVLLQALRVAQVVLVS